MAKKDGRPPYRLTVEKGGQKFTTRREYHRHPDAIGDGKLLVSLGWDRAVVSDPDGDLDEIKIAPKEVAHSGR